MSNQALANANHSSRCCRSGRRPLLHRLTAGLLAVALLWSLGAMPAAAQSVIPVTVPGTAPIGPQTGAAPRSDAEVVAQATPSVVRIETDLGYGSGVQIEQGLLTAEHVIVDAERIDVIATDGRRAKATVIRSDHKYDLALLQVDLKLPALALDLARSQRQADPLLVLGYPRADVFKSGPATLTRGVLSAVRQRPDGIVFVQTDAPMNPGNSGGPILNTAGKVVGIADQVIQESSGLNLGVATESIQAFLTAPMSRLEPTPLLKADKYENDNSPGTARLLALDGTAEKRSFHEPKTNPADFSNASLAATVDQDWVFFELAAGEHVKLTTNSSWCYTRIYLFAPDTSVVAAGDFAKGSDITSAEYGATQSGIYFGLVVPSALRLQLSSEGHLQLSYYVFGDEACRGYELTGTRLPNGGNSDQERAGPAFAPDEAWMPRLLMAQGLAYEKLDRYEEAVAAFDQALALQPDLAGACICKGLALLHLGRYEEAVEAFDQALAVRPDFPDALTNKGIALSDLGRNEEALVAYDTSLALRPNHPITLRNKGNRLRLLGRYEEALDAYEAYLTLTPDDAVTLTNKGLVLANLRRYEDAVSAYDASLAARPNDAATLIDKGHALANLRRWEEALAAYDASIAARPNDAATLADKGVALSNLGRNAEALSAYDASIVLRPNDPRTLNQRSLALTEAGRYDEALADAERTVALNRNPSVLDTHAYVLIKLGRFDEALSDYDALFALVPDTTSAYYHLGRGLALIGVGRAEEGRSDLEIGVVSATTVPRAGSELSDLLAMATEALGSA